VTATPLTVVRATDDDSVVVDYANQPPLVPDNEYQAVFVHYETAYIFRCPKVILWFKIVEPGEHFGKMVFRPYRVKAIKGKPRRGGGIVLRRGSDCFKMLCRVLDLKLRPDRISLNGLRECVLRIRTRTVTKDYAQDSLPDWLQYSVVDDILRKETG
jgi:hypothetical protein